jgi:hypothetical protein
MNGINKKKKWLGIIDTDNIHKNYLWSKSYSRKLKKEIEKRYLEITLSTINWNLYRGQRIPVMIGRESMSDKNLSGFEINKSLTAWYTISEISFHWERGIFYQKLKLLRKDWNKSVNEL